MPETQRKTYPSTAKYSSRLYRTWSDMRHRCNSPKAFNYADYGGRGIKICDEWQRYDNFKSWADNSGYSDDLSIDRINNDGGYSPENCRWATPKQQSNNRRNTLYLTFNGSNKALAEWAEIYGIDRSTLAGRIYKRGWDAERALTAPIRPKRCKGVNDG